MQCRISKSFRFSAAHWLPEVSAGHKCARLHGHTYEVTLGLEGPIHPQLGWVEDYGRIATAFEEIRRELDHCCLNEIEGLANPTAEILAAWIYRRLEAQLPLLTDVCVRETPTTAAVYRPVKDSEP